MQLMTFIKMLSSKVVRLPQAGASRIVQSRPLFSSGSSSRAGLASLHTKAAVTETFPVSLQTEEAEEQPVQFMVSELDAKRFHLDPSVSTWSDYQFEGKELDLSTVQGLNEYLQLAARNAQQAGVLSSAQSALYWSYHTSRMAFFIMQGVLTIRGGQERMESGGQGEAQKSGGMYSRAISDGPALAQRLLKSIIPTSLSCYKQDYKWIQQGVYKFPWDVETTSHRQYNPLWVMNRVRQFLSDGSKVYQRQATGKAEDLWFKSNLYPDYYLNTFHYQTDGWLSSASASVYEMQTETIFLGRQDAMQRSAMVNMHSYLSGKPTAGMSLLELGCGTGRFLTFLKDNYRDMDMTGLDLSPFYLQEARSNMKYWKEQRAPALGMGGFEGTGVQFMQAPAEKVPLPDASQDIIVCVYLFHELPPQARVAVLGEVARLLKPGGLFVLTDSYQYGDLAYIKEEGANFGNFNEPYYESYYFADLGQMMEEAGLKCDMKVVQSATKSLSALKPLSA